MSRARTVFLHALHKLDCIVPKYMQFVLGVSKCSSTKVRAGPETPRRRFSDVSNYSVTKNKYLVQLTSSTRSLRIAASLSDFIPLVWWNPERMQQWTARQPHLLALGKYWNTVLREHTCPKVREVSGFKRTSSVFVGHRYPLAPWHGDALHFYKQGLTLKHDEA